MTNSSEISYLTSGDDRLARYRDEADHARLAALLPTRPGLLSRLVNRSTGQRPATAAATKAGTPARRAGASAGKAGRAGSARVPVRP